MFIQFKSFYFILKDILHILNITYLHFYAYYFLSLTFFNFSIIVIVFDFIIFKGLNSFFLFTQVVILKFEFICMYSYIGTYGNADPLDVLQWQQLGVSVPIPTRRFDARTGICTNMFTGIYLNDIFSIIFITYYFS